MPTVSFRPTNVEQLSAALDVLEIVGSVYQPDEATVQLSWGNEGLLMKISTFVERDDQETCVLTLLNMPAESFDDFECTGPYACRVRLMTQLCQILSATPQGCLVSLITRDADDVSGDDDDDDGEEEEEEEDRNSIFDFGDGEEENEGEVDGLGLIVTFEHEGDNGYLENAILDSSVCENDYEFEEIEVVKRVQIRPDVFCNSIWLLPGMGTVYISTDGEEVQFLERPTNEVVLLNAENGDCTIDIEDGVEPEMQLVGLCPGFLAGLVLATAVSDRIELLGTRCGEVAVECRIPDLGRIRICEVEP